MPGQTASIFCAESRHDTPHLHATATASIQTALVRFAREGLAYVLKGESYGGQEQGCKEASRLLRHANWHVHWCGVEGHCGVVHHNVIRPRTQGGLGGQKRGQNARATRAMAPTRVQLRTSRRSSEVRAQGSPPTKSFSGSSCCMVRPRTALVEDWRSGASTTQCHLAARPSHTPQSRAVRCS
jgi:hypothetical protein